jgi:ribonuclease HII
VPAVGQRPDLAHECGLWAHGYHHVAGLDEVGRGAWAGPVVAAAVVLPPDRLDLPTFLAPVRDSKLLTPRSREHCYELVCACALSYGVGAVPADEIDRLGIVPATRLAMELALQSLAFLPDYLLIDALDLPLVPIPQWAAPKADRDLLSVAAASIVAKVSRDHWMVALDARLPGYGLAQHKGYGTAEHRAALQVLGPSPQHRRSFAPIADLVGAHHG